MDEPEIEGVVLPFWRCLSCFSVMLLVERCFYGEKRLMYKVHSAQPPVTSPVPAISVRCLSQVKEGHQTITFEMRHSPKIGRRKGRAKGICQA